DTLWWWFDCKETALIRRLAMETLVLTVTHPDPLVRFPMMESIERCGDVFFSNTVILTQELTPQTGRNYRYYGEYHRVRANGHLHPDERLFTGQTLTPTQRQAASQLVDRMFDMFEQELDLMLDYARRATAQPLQTTQELQRERRERLQPLAA